MYFLFSIESQTAFDSAYMKGQLELTLYYQCQLKLILDVSRVNSCLTLRFYQSYVGDTVDSFAFLCVYDKYNEKIAEDCRCIRPGSVFILHKNDPICFQGLQCCSDYPIGFHYVTKEKLKVLDYFLYSVKKKFDLGIPPFYNDTKMEVKGY